MNYMTYLFYEIENETKARVYGVNNDPNGLLTEDQKAKAIEVAEIPKEIYIEGKYPQYYVNPQTKDVWIEYIDRQLTAEEEVQMLKQKNAELESALVEMTTLAAEQEQRSIQNEQAIMELTTLVGGMTNV